ncbi:MAG TPA: F0F1 ATP synthase subunit A [Puia sp.]|nr:F0F1 ATP synthase subunit A [Puia sp.]
MSYGQQNPASGEGARLPDTAKIDPSGLILEHIANGHEFHFFNFHGRIVSIPLPVILYSPQNGWSFFMASRFKHGERAYAGYRLLTEEYISANRLDKKVYKAGQIVAVKDDGSIDPAVRVYDFSLGRNVTQMLISILLLVWIMTSAAKKYKQGIGVRSAPSGMQSLLEPIIIFIRDEVAKVNLGNKYEKYMPFLLTIFFFILINALLGLIPGTANVVGNIAFTGALGVLAFIAIMFSTGKHYWLHIVNPPVPLGVKPIMIPVEILGIFTKPFALIIRLFANMISGHIIILSFIILIFVFGAMNTGLGWGTSPFFILMAVFIYLIELLVAFIQAYIFAALTAVFIGLAFESHQHHDDHNGHASEILTV